jgi:hypothetical protein
MVSIVVMTILALPTGVNIDTFIGGRIRAAFVARDVLRHVMQVDGAFQKTPSRRKESG